MTWRTTCPAGARQAVEYASARRAPPGLAAAVVTADGAVELVTSGLADVRTGRPVTIQTTFLWFSTTKIMTATAVMMLADRGAVELDAPVIEHVPEMGVLRGPGSLITARHLLAHSSGLANPRQFAGCGPQARRRPMPGCSWAACCTGTGGSGSTPDRQPPTAIWATSSSASSSPHVPGSRFVSSSAANCWSRWGCAAPASSTSRRPPTSRLATGGSRRAGRLPCGCCSRRGLSARASAAW